MSQPENSSPELSVIVTVVDGGETLERCLESLSHQANPPVMEVIVPYDSSIAEVADLARRFPEFRFLDLGSLLAEPARDEYQRHVLYDRRRSGGLKEAKGHLVAMVEDRGRPRPDWARAMADLHASNSFAAVGGQSRTKRRATCVGPSSSAISAATNRRCRIPVPTI